MLAGTQRSPSPAPATAACSGPCSVGFWISSEDGHYSLSGQPVLVLPHPQSKKEAFFSSSFSCVIFCLNGISHVSVCAHFLLFILVALRIWLHLCFLISHYHCSFYSVSPSKHRRWLFCALLICFANTRNVMICLTHLGFLKKYDKYLCSDPAYITCKGNLRTSLVPS